MKYHYKIYTDIEVLLTEFYCNYNLRRRAHHFKLDEKMQLTKPFIYASLPNGEINF